MNEVLEQKFAEALENHKKLIELEGDFADQGMAIKTESHSFGVFIREAYSNLIGAIGPNTLVFRLDGRTYETKLTQNGLLIELPRNGSNDPSSIDTDDLVTRVTKLIGDDAQITVEINDGYIYSSKYENIGLYINVDSLRDKPVLEANAVFDPIEEDGEFTYFSDYSDKIKKLLRVNQNDPYHSELIDWLSKKSKSYSEKVFTYKTPHRRQFRFELLESLQNVAEFLSFIEECADIVQWDKYMLTSLSIQIPMGDLEILQRPPIFKIKYEGDIGLDYDYSFRPKGRPVMNEEKLRLLVPQSELWKAAEFFDGLKIEPRW